jgi:beta-lactamase class A
MSGGLSIRFVPGIPRWRGALLLTSLLGTTGAAIWAASPVMIVGRLLDAGMLPVAGAVVSMAAGPLSPASAVRSDGRGDYRIASRHWPPQVPVLSVSAPGFVPMQTAGGPLTLHRWPRLEGRVLDDQGQAMAGAVVGVSSSAGPMAAAMTDFDGHFSLMLPRLTGTVSVTAWMPEHDTASAPAALAVDGAATVAVTLARQLAKLHLDSDPNGQAPLVDGLPAQDCPGTPCDLTLLAGAHRITFGSDQYAPWQQDVEVVKDEQASVTAKLERKMGTLQVNAPAGGELTIDGQAVSGSSWSGAVPTGKHAVVFRSASTWPALLQADVGWNATAKLDVAPAAVAPGNTGSFADGVRAYLAAQGGGSYGVYVEELSTGATIGVGDTASMEAASVIKVPNALYLLHQVDAGQVKLDDQIDLHPEDFMSGTGSLNGTAQPGDKYSYRQLLTLMIQQSDNTAWQALRRVLGASRIDGYAASLGAGDCQQVSDACSARSAGHMLAQLARGRLLSGGSTQLLMNLLETTIFNDRINWYLPNLTVAHKVGMDGSVMNDCGVVYQQGDPFVICVFTDTPDPTGGVQAIRDLARAADHYFGG